MLNNNGKIIKKIEESLLCEYQGKKFILVPYQEEVQNKPIKYKNINIAPWGDENEKTYIEFDDFQYTNEIFEFIAKNINDKNLFDILNEINNTFILDKKKYKKFRGDFGEAIFIYQKGGFKANDHETFDIILNDDYVEVKTFSEQEKLISISLKQINENTLKYAVELKSDSNGKNIIDLANLIKDVDSNMYNYLINEYKSDNYLYKLKFEITNPIDITDQISDEIELPDNIVAAKFKLRINI